MKQFGKAQGSRNERPYVAGQWRDDLTIILVSRESAAKQVFCRDAVAVLSEWGPTIGAR